MILILLIIERTKDVSEYVGSKVKFEANSDLFDYEMKSFDLISLGVLHHTGNFKEHLKKYVNLQMVVFLLDYIINMDVNHF